MYALSGCFSSMAANGEFFWKMGLNSTERVFYLRSARNAAGANTRDCWSSFHMSRGTYGTNSSSLWYSGFEYSVHRDTIRTILKSGDPIVKSADLSTDWTLWSPPLLKSQLLTIDRHPLATVPAVRRQPAYHAAYTTLHSARVDAGCSVQAAAAAALPSARWAEHGTRLQTSRGHDGAWRPPTVDKNMWHRAAPIWP